MPDFTSPEYQQYLNDQITDNLSRDYDAQYLDTFVGKTIYTYDRDLKVLDIGARTFSSWDWWYAFCDIRPTGIDVCADALALARKQGKRLIDCDAHCLQDVVDDGSLDIITAFHSFEHMYDLPCVIKNCFNALKPGGLLYLAVPIPSFNWKRGHWYDIPDEKAMLKLCTDAGFVYKWDLLLRDNEIRPQVEYLLTVEKPA